MKRNFGLAAIFFLVILALVIFALARAAKNQETVFTVEDAAKSIEVKTGDTFRVKLMGNPSTGFSWHCTVDQEAVIKLVSDKIENSKGIGAPAQHIFEFKALKAGTAQVKFDYRRPWDAEDVAETYVFNFTVK